MQAGNRAGARVRAGGLAGVERGGEGRGTGVVASRHPGWYRLCFHPKYYLGLYAQVLGHSRRAMPYVITEACIGTKDKSCVDVCPVDCIYEGEQMLYIHPDECIDCGACEPECPVTAIFPEEDVPPQMKQYIQKNKEVFNSDTPP